MAALAPPAGNAAAPANGLAMISLRSLKTKPEIHTIGKERLLCFPQLDGTWIPGTECTCRDLYDGTGPQPALDCPIDRHSLKARQLEISISVAHKPAACHRQHSAAGKSQGE